MRITTTMMNRNYMGTLGDAAAGMSAASLKSTNYRKFQTVSDDPAGAAKAFQLRREYSDVGHYLDNAQDADGKLKTAESAIMSMEEKIKDISDRIIHSLNDPSKDDRDIFAKELKSIQGAMLQEMNTSFAGQHIFGGSEGTAVPFTVGDDGRLLYRGEALDGANFDQSSLDVLSQEKILVDFGFGIDPENPNSGFDISLPGINFLGYGETDQGVSKNLYNLIGDMADYLVSEDFTHEGMDLYTNQFDASKSTFLQGLTEMGSKSHSIEYTVERLKTSELNIKEKINYVEFVSPESAISEFKMQEFAYRATLSIGTKIIQPTLIDFMK